MIDPESQKSYLRVPDYVALSIMFLISAAIGAFYAWRGRKVTSISNLLVGDRSLNVYAVALSVMATTQSGIIMLGVPTEVYLYDTQYSMFFLALILALPITAYLYIPVFYNLGITSIYEYLELRFGRGVRTLGCAFFIFHMIMYIPVVIYAPVLALAEVTGLSIYFSVLSVGLICTFYTSIGGMKAVVWSDVFQSVVVYVALLAVVIKGTSDVGGVAEVGRRSIEGERLHFLNFDPNPTVRHTFWTLLVGGFIFWIAQFSVNQAVVQRYVTVPTLKKAQRTLWINLPAILLLIAVLQMTGLIVFAYYYNCDPLTIKTIKSPEQVFPRFVMETLGFVPGMTGLFISGIFSGSLSTMSSGVNSLAAVTLEDIIKTYIKKDIGELWSTRIITILSIAYGLIAVALVFIARQLGTILQVAQSVQALLLGPQLGLFTLGMFFPWTNTLGAVVGILSGLVASLWIGMGAFVHKPYIPRSPVSVEGCLDVYLNMTQTMNPVISSVVPPSEDIFPLYRISYMWFTGIGFFVTMIVGLVFSFLRRPTKFDEVDSKLLAPGINKFWSYILCRSGAMKINKGELPKDTVGFTTYSSHSTLNISTPNLND